MFSHHLGYLLKDPPLPRGHSHLADVGESQRVDGLAGHVGGEAALRLPGHRLVEGHVQEAEVRPLLGVLHQRGGFARACQKKVEPTNVRSFSKKPFG